MRTDLEQAVEDGIEHVRRRQPDLERRLLSYRARRRAYDLTIGHNISEPPTLSRPIGRTFVG
jgi:hypothetical protein